MAVLTRHLTHIHAPAAPSARHAAFLCSPHQPSFQARAETPPLLRSPARSGLFKCYAEHLYNRELRQREHGDADVYVFYRERYSWDSQHTKQFPKPGVLHDPLMGDDRRDQPDQRKKMGRRRPARRPREGAMRGGASRGRPRAAGAAQGRVGSAQAPAANAGGGLCGIKPALGGFCGEGCLTHKNALGGPGRARR